MLDNRVPQFGGADVAVKSHREFRSNRDAYFTSYLNDTTPAVSSVRAKGLAAHKGNASMSQGVQMSQNQLCRKTVVEYQVSHTVDGTVSAYCHNGNRERMLQRRINGDKSLRAPADEHSAVFFDQMFLAPVMRGEVKIPRFRQMIADAPHHLIVVSLTQVGH